jgi:hypothetical protein
MSTVINPGDKASQGGPALIELICGDCPFYKESDADLECGAFVILKRLIAAGTVTAEQVRDARRG